MEHMLIVSNLDEIASRWQIPVERIQHLIVVHGMDMAQPEKWAAAHSDLILEEKRKAFDELLFPRPFRPEPAETTA